MLIKISALCIFLCAGLFFSGCQESITNGSDANALNTASTFNAGNGQTVAPLEDEDPDDGGNIQLDIFDVSFAPRLQGQIPTLAYTTKNNSPNTTYNVINIEEATIPDLNHFWSVEYNGLGGYDPELFTYEWRMYGDLHLQTLPQIQLVNGPSAVLTTDAYHVAFPLRFRVTLTVHYDGQWMNTFAAEYRIPDPNH